MTSFRSIIELWPTREALAAATGANAAAVCKWHKRDWIPSNWWPRLLRTKEARDAGLTADKLASVAERVRSVA